MDYSIYKKEQYDTIHINDVEFRQIGDTYFYVSNNYNVYNIKKKAFVNYDISVSYRESKDYVKKLNVQKVADIIFDKIAELNLKNDEIYKNGIVYKNIPNTNIYIQNKIDRELYLNSKVIKKVGNEYRPVTKIYSYKIKHEFKTFKYGAILITYNKKRHVLCLKELQHNLFLKPDTNFWDNYINA